MTNILDYIAWRGDLEFRECPLNEVDALILCQLSYIDFSGIVADTLSSESLSLGKIAELFRHSPDFKERSDMGLLINAQTIDLLQRAGESLRFGSLTVGAYINKIDCETEEQFSAICFSHGNEWTFLAFRGTDDTLVGWKEDFNLGYMDSVPAQTDALCYLESIADALPENQIFLGGHSKGGNLALYAAAHANTDIQKRLLTVFSNDGPGFRDDFFSSDGYLAIKDRVCCFVPRLSIVGMLFEREDGYTVVDSTEKNMFMQHDPFNWHVLGKHFVTCKSRGDESKFVDRTVNKWIKELTPIEREQFIETIFGILQDTEAKTNSELSANWFENILKMLKSTQKLSAKARNAAISVVQQLFKIMMDDWMSGGGKDKAD